MDAQDLSQNHRIARLTRLTRDLAQSRAPDETLEVVRRAFADAHGFVASMLLSTRGLRPGQYRVVYAELYGGPRKGLKGVNGGRRHEQGLVRSGGVVAAMINGPRPRLIQNVDWSRDPVFHRKLGRYTSVMAVPLAGDRLPMDWAILLKESPESFTASDLEEAVERAALLGALLENQILAGELRRANEQLDEEARQVGELQRALLPPSPPRVVGLEVAASYEPAARAGGDLYDFFPIDDGHGADTTAARWCTFIGDAAGHSLATAVVMAIVQAVLHAHPAHTAGPATLLSHANRQLCGMRLGGFVTAFLGVYEPGSRRLTYANAGHPNPLLRRSSDGSVTALDEVGSYPLGIDESETFQEAAVQFEPGDTVVLYTDGIIEAGDMPADLFGTHRLTRILRDAPERPAELIDRLHQAVVLHERGQAAVDDQTLVAARIL